MLFEKQKYQEDCVRNILKVFEGVKYINDLSILDDLPAIKDNIKKLQDTQRIPIKEVIDKLRLDILMETGTGKTFTYLKAMYQLNKEYGINKFVLFVPRTAIREGVIQNIDLTSDYFSQEYGTRIKKYTYDSKTGLSQIFSYLRDKNEFSLLILTSASITGKTENDRILTRQSEKLGTMEAPLDEISKMNPIMFIDEPHLLTGKGFIEKYKKYFENSVCLRFGATFPVKPKPGKLGKSAKPDKQEHHHLSNVVYVLDSLSAFRQYLVKKIRVTTIIDETVGIKFSTIKDKSVKIHYFKENKEYSKQVKCQQDLGALTENQSYNGVYIKQITNNKIYLSNHSEHNIDKNNYNLTDESIRLMIRKTINTHFEKEAVLFNKNIKTLSLFFIPNVDDFRKDNPRIKKIFEEEYKQARTNKLKENLNPSYRDYLEQDYDENDQLRVHDGYFSGEKGNIDERETSGINLILKDKIKLLSFKTPLRFIFSVWALQEGWDNPNIFNICKLASNHQETSRRQQVGRGLRLAVNQAGKRQTISYCHEDKNEFYNINILDVIVSGHEKEFVEGIQKEINNNSYGTVAEILTIEILQKSLGLNEREASRLINWLEDKGIIIFDEDIDSYHVNAPIHEFLQAHRDNSPDALHEKYDELIKYFTHAAQSPVSDGNQKPLMIKIRQERFAKFEALWNKITQTAKIIYRDIDNDVLIENIVTVFNQENIDPISIISRTKVYDHETNQVKNNIPVEVLGKVDFFNQQQTYQNFIFDFAKKEKLPFSFVLKIMNNLNKDKIKNDPKKAYRLLATIIKESIHQHIIQSVFYDFTDSPNSEIAIKARSVFYDDTGNPRTEIEARKIGRYPSEKNLPTQEAPPHYLYDTVRYDSNIERDVILGDPEEVIIDESGQKKKITVFAKLPSVSIPTPYKTYNPDFAYFIETKEGNKLFLIVETKGYDRITNIPGNEQMKINYAEKFFAQLNAITPDVDVVFKQRINKDELHELLQRIGNES